MLRTADCGSLREKDIDSQQTLAGWVDRRRDHGGIIFIDLRDRSGLVQVVLNPELSTQAYQVAEQLRSEWVVQVKGTVRRRPEGSENPGVPKKTTRIDLSPGGPGHLPRLHGHSSYGWKLFGSNGFRPECGPCGQEAEAALARFFRWRLI